MGASLCSPCANPAAPWSLPVPCWGASIPAHCLLPPFPQDCLPACTHTDPQRFPLLVMCSHFCASIRLLFGGQVDFAFSAGTGGTVRWFLMEEMMCQVLLSSPLVRLEHAHAVLVLFLLNMFSPSWTSQKLSNFLLFPCILQPPPPPFLTPPKKKTKPEK